MPKQQTKTQPSSPSAPPPSNSGLDLSDLNSPIGAAWMPSDGHFGLDSGIWDNIQAIADLLPFKVNVYGDLTEEELTLAADVAKSAEIQAENWNENKSLVERTLKARKKVLESQQTVAEKVSELRLEQAKLEAELAKNLGADESEYRKVIGSSRATTQNQQEDLKLSLIKIANQYAEGRAKKIELINTQETKEKEVTPYQEQITGIREKFKSYRAARLEGQPVAIMRRA
jgi:hypothetical protein